MFELSEIGALCRGSAGVSALRRAGYQDVKIVDGGLSAQPPFAAFKPAAALRNKVGGLKDEITLFLNLEAGSADPNFDQNLAVALAKAYVDGALPVDPSARPEPIGLTGGAGYGKTYTIGRVIMETSIEKVIVVAPTNAAVGVLKRALEKQGALSAPGKSVSIATAHKAFLALALTPMGAAVFSALSSSKEEIILAPEMNPVVADEVNSTLAKMAKNPARVKRVQKAVDSALEVRGKPSFGAMAMRACAAAGFKGLDPRLCFWAPVAVGSDTAVIIDEVGMVGQRLVRHLLDCGAKVILSGDPYQLPPVSTDFVDASGRSLPDKSAITLMAMNRTVHLQFSRRTEDGSPIPDLAAKCFYLSKEAMRNEIRAVAADYPDHIRTYERIGLVPVGDFDLGPALAWRNVTRLTALGHIRTMQGRPVDRFEVGETLICNAPPGRDSACALPLEKNSRYVIRDIRQDLESGSFLYAFEGVSLGMEDAEGGDDFDFSEIYLSDPSCDDSSSHKAASRWLSEIKNVNANCRSEYWGDDLPAMGPASVMSVHKAQGGGWPVVTIFLGDIFGCERPDTNPLPDDRIVEGWRRLLYVALTRTSGRLNVLC
jgi:hypothetical protein